MFKDDEKDMPWIMQQFKLMSQIDHVKAQDLLQSKAVSKMVEWSNLPITDFKKTHTDWQKVWQENEELEKLIYDEEKGYRIENKNIIREAQNKVEFMRERFMFYTEAIDIAKNEREMDLMHHIDQVEMELED